MEKVKDSVVAIVEADGIYMYNEYKLEVSYDDEIPDAYDAAKEELKRQKENLVKKAIWTREESSTNLFAGRVKLVTDRYSGMEFSVDDIIIISPYLENFYFQNTISFERAALYLNAIAAHGVDHFIENYKNTLKNMAVKLETDLNEEIDLFKNSGSSDEKKISQIQNWKKNLRQLWAVLFLVQIHLPLGIENERLLSAYEQINNLAY